VGYKTAMFFGIGLPMMFSTIFVFLIGKELFNTKAGLLAALLVNLADTHISFGYQLIPTSIGVALFTIVLYLLVKNRKKRELTFTFLTILFMFLLVITHNMSSFVLLCCIAFLLLGVFMYNRANAEQFPNNKALLL
jgi:asparagine N-glycosylation enzyme membrane subunit Stt3